MEPLRGRAEHISARTAAVIIMKKIVIKNDDLECGEKQDQKGKRSATILLQVPQREVQGRGTTFNKRRKKLYNEMNWSEWL
jgi:hypothetical protein